MHSMSARWLLAKTHCVMIDRQPSSLKVAPDVTQSRIDMREKTPLVVMLLLRLLFDGEGDDDDDEVDVEGLPILRTPIKHDRISQSENVPPALFRRQMAEFVEVDEDDAEESWLKTLELILLMSELLLFAVPHFSKMHFDTFVFVTSWNVVAVDDNGAEEVEILLLLLLILAEE